MGAARAGLKVLVALAVLAGVGSGAFFAARALRGTSGTEAGGPTAEAVTELREALSTDAQKPRFGGELLGVYIASSGEEVPPKYKANVTPECEVQGSIVVPWERAGQFDLAVELPPQFVFQPDDINTGVLAWVCNDHVYVARWAYSHEQPQFENNPGSVVIARGEFRWETVSAPAERVGVTAVGGRTAILIEPVRPGGGDLLGQVGTQAEIIFPEPFGTTIISSSGVPLEELLTVAGIVGGATR